MEPREIFEAAYRIVVEHASAPDREGVDAFVHAFTTRPLSYEWRFCGSLGFGGKFWRNDNRYYISCYPEDRTPARQKTIDKVNELLKALPYYEPPV